MHRVWLVFSAEVIITATATCSDTTTTTTTATAIRAAVVVVVVGAGSLTIDESIELVEPLGQSLARVSAGIELCTQVIDVPG